MTDIKSGDKFRKVYPFCSWSNSYQSGFGREEIITEDGWAGGCKKHYEDGPEVSEGQCLQEEFHSCDAEGEIEYEVLAYVKMPRKYQSRILYRVTMIEPEGRERKSSKCHTITETKFRQWIQSGYSSYPHDYGVTG